jgi:hypothetical protein
LRLAPIHWLELERQRHLYQGSVAAAAGLLLQRTGTAGVQVNEVPVFCAPDIFSARFAFIARVIFCFTFFQKSFLHNENDMKQTP